MKNSWTVGSRDRIHHFILIFLKLWAVHAEIKSFCHSSFLPFFLLQPNLPWREVLFSNIGTRNIFDYIVNSKPELETNFILFYDIYIFLLLNC